MLNGTLEKIALCKSRPAPGCRNEFEAMLHSRPDPDAPVRDSAGNIRSLYLYRPASGVIPCSAGIVVLRETGGEASAVRLLEKTGWAERAERDHYAILLPEPAPGGWSLSGQNGAGPTTKRICSVSAAICGKNIPSIPPASTARAFPWDP